MHSKLSAVLCATLYCSANFVLAAEPPGLKVEGWIQADYSESSAVRSNLPLGFNLFADSSHLHQAWLTLDYPMVKPTPEARGRLGLHLDAYAGTDYFFTRARGLFSSQTSEIGFDPLQFYVEGHTRGPAKGTDVRIGRFSSPIGAEYNAGPSNMLASHSYSFIYDPFTHTGALATTTLDARWSLMNGIMTGSDIFVDPAARATFLNGARYVDDRDNRKSAQLITILGPGRFDAARGFNHIDVVDLVVTYPLSKRLLFTGHAVYGWEDAVPVLGNVDWLGLVPYFTYTFSDSVAATLRLEHFNDDEGNRTGFAGAYRTATLGCTWKTTKWLTLRPELRFDHHDGAAPFEGKDHLTTAVIDAIARF